MIEIEVRLQRRRQRNLRPATAGTESAHHTAAPVSGRLDQRTSAQHLAAEGRAAEFCPRPQQLIAQRRVIPFDLQPTAGHVKQIETVGELMALRARERGTPAGQLIEQQVAQRAAAKLRCEVTGARQPPQRRQPQHQQRLAGASGIGIGQAGQAPAKNGDMRARKRRLIVRRVPRFSTTS